MKIFQEFKEFAIKGNVVDLGVGVLIGTAFGKVVSSFANDVILSPLSILLKKANYEDYFWVLKGGEYATLAEAKAAGATTLNYGAFFTSVFDFLIIAVIVFLFVKQVNRFRRKQEVEQKA